jgi:hypothetical protein
LWQKEYDHEEYHVIQRMCAVYINILDTATDALGAGGNTNSIAPACASSTSVVGYKRSPRGSLIT